MALLILFIVALFILPFQMDAKKNGSNNIFKRAGKELVETEWMSSFLEFLNLSLKKVSSFVVGLAFTVIFLVAVYLLIKLVSFFINLFS